LRLKGTPLRSKSLEIHNLKFLHSSSNKALKTGRYAEDNEEIDSEIN
jgi:hypothetical protein